MREIRSANRGGYRWALHLVVVAAAMWLASVASVDAATFRYNPILFVHGIEGSGAQFESQALRFESNRYPAGWIDEVDYNSTRAVGDTSEVHQQIGDAIAALQLRTGKAQVDVISCSSTASTSRPRISARRRSR